LQSLQSSHEYSNLTFGTNALTKNILCIPTESNQLIFYQLPTTNNNHNNHNDKEQKRKKKNNKNQSSSSSSIVLDPILECNMGTHTTANDNHDSSNSHTNGDNSHEAKKKKRPQSAIAVCWHSKLNQLVCVGTDGNAKLFYNTDSTSKKTSHYQRAMTQYQQSKADDLTQLFQSRAAQGYSNISSSQMTIQNLLSSNPSSRKRKQQER